MDLVQEDQRDVIFSEREEDLKKLSKPLDCTCFRTSIWDETLYKAWSSIVYMLIPNVKDMESSLNEFAEILDADEVSLTLQLKNAKIKLLKRNWREAIAGAIYKNIIDRKDDPKEQVCTGKLGENGIRGGSGLLFSLTCMIIA